MKNKKRLLLLPLMALALAGCGKKAEDEGKTPAETVVLTLESDALQIIAGGQKTLSVVATGSEGEVQWTSSDTTVLSISSEGRIEALKAGSSTVTASYGGKTATCVVTVVNFSDVYIMSVSKNDNIKTFEENVKNDSGEFKGATSDVIEVGDDNAFVMKPKITILDKETFEDVDDSVWTLGYVFSIKEKVEEAYVEPTETYGTFDQDKCAFDFNESAIGKEFQLSVMPGGLSAEQQADPAYTTTVKVKVSNGYNVYSANELAYFNDVEFPNIGRQNDEIGQYYNDSWKQFRRAHGLDEAYVAPSVFLQADVKVTKDNLPSKFFFASETEGGPVGYMKDGTDCYARYSDGFAFNGNYFNVDTAQIPVAGDVDSDGISHSTLFKVYEPRVENDVVSNVSFKNCSYFGNGQNGAEATKAAGGLIFFKVSGESENVSKETNLIVNATFDNFNVKAATISFYAEYVPSKMTISNCIVSDGYANSIYLYMNGDVDITNSVFKKFGGPIIVTDGAGTDDKDEIKDGFHVVIDSATVLDNWVSGSEAWFVSTGANNAIPLIQGNNSKFAPMGLSFMDKDLLMNVIMVNCGASPYASLKIGDGAAVGFDKNSPEAAGLIAAASGDGAYNLNATQANPVPSLVDLMMSNPLFGFVHFVVSVFPIAQ